jgi:hypothetical protein
VTGTGSDLGKSYVAFVRGNMDQVAKKISDDLFVLSTMEVRQKWMGHIEKWGRSIHGYKPFLKHGNIKINGEYML